MTTEEARELTDAIRTYHAAALEAERGGLVQVSLVTQLAAAERETGRLTQELADLRARLAQYETPRSRLRLVAK